MRKFLFAIRLSAARPRSGTNFLRPQTRTCPAGLPTISAAQRRAQVSPPHTPPCSPSPPPPPHILPPTPGAQNLKPTPKRREGGRGSRIEILQKHLQNKASDLAGGWTGRVGTPRSGRFPSSFFFFKIHVICVFERTKKHNRKNPKRPGLPSRVERRWRQVEFGSAGAPAHAAFH